MVGGGLGAFIGEVHRKASRLDGQVELVSGAFDIRPEKSGLMGKELGLDKKRVYSNYLEMIEKESNLPEEERIDFVTIVTPNNWHFPIARDFLKAGFHVLCEKPMTLNVKEAKELEKVVKKSGKIFALNHNYTGYPMVKLARDLVAKGELGEVRKIVVQYIQGWLATNLEKSGNQQASWRTDPKQSGGAGCIGDIGSHAENLAEYVSGLKITEICADLTAFVPGRLLDDDGNCLLKFNNGAKGVLKSSQICIGEENNLAIWVYGEKKSLEWHQEEPNHLVVRSLDAPEQIWRRGNAYLGKKSSSVVENTRLPAGHPEAFFEALANIYSGFVKAIKADGKAKKNKKVVYDFPTVEDGLRGMQFIQTVLDSAKSKQKWTKMKS